ncbi:NADP(+) coupled glycerol dehydrogenase [Xylogone sp. PMI_703]|nr:NADP(+) coupled glycerol dehydrogenase [Xylogone sp. PMI_703]
MDSPTYFPLNSGSKIPAIGLGTGGNLNGQYERILFALKHGVRHIDTATIYGSEAIVGQAIRDSGIPREEIFVTTKLWNNDHHPDDVEPALSRSLENLGLEYVDLYLMHWPVAFVRNEGLLPKGVDGRMRTKEVDYLTTWQAMEKLVNKGMTKSIGISNFSRAELDRLLAHASIRPAVHQLEIHPWLQQPEFANYHKELGIHLTQYSPLGHRPGGYNLPASQPRLVEDPAIVEVGKRYDKSGAQVVLAWGIAHGRSVIPKSSSLDRLLSNLQSDFRLEAEDVRLRDMMDQKLRLSDESYNFNYDFFKDLDGKQNMNFLLN